ncbi:MAG: nitronate monooxygenase [Chloroflexota bacterium]|nr:nitronate monooxygenase [Chloroflexota bacterium]
MSIRTLLTEKFGSEYPIVLAPMGSVAGGRLAAAVSNAGALGLVGGGYGDPEWLRAELSTARSETTRPWGVGLITWHATHKTVELALSYEPHAFMLSFGDPSPFVPAIKEADCTLICQVQDVEDGRAARAAGADIIVAQGTEAGGHGADRSTLPLVPAVVDAVGPTPVLAAGGIVDGRGLAAALMLGAQGALIGTRFYAATEALGHKRAKERIVAAKGRDTRRTRVFDMVRQHAWPQPYTGRAIRNPFMERWDGKEDDLGAALDEEILRFRAAVKDADFDTAMIWAGEGVDLVSDVAPAGELVRRIGAETEAHLRQANELLGRTGPMGSTTGTNLGEST